MPRRPRTRAEKAEAAFAGISSHGTPYVRRPYKNSPDGAQVQTAVPPTKRARFKAAGLTVRGTMPVAATQAHIASMAAERERRAAVARETEARVTVDRITHEADPRTLLYRAEREAKQQRHAGVMADAKAQYERLLADLKVSQKGGRPRKQVNARRDPADALIAALEGSR